MAFSLKSDWTTYFDTFLEVHSSPFDETTPPFKVHNAMILNNEEQLESWSMEWCMHYLFEPPKDLSPTVDSSFRQLNNNSEASSSSASGLPVMNACPVDLIPLLCRAVANIVMKSDVSELAAETEGWLSSNKLLAHVLNTLKDVISSWRQSMRVETSPDALRHNACVCSIKNGRRKMEDAHCLIPNLHALYNLENQDFLSYAESPRQSFYAVFDGHGGAEAAEYACANLHRVLVNHRSFPSDAPQALKEAIETVDQEYCSTVAPVFGGMAGCVAVVALFRERELHVAWLGDCQAVLVEAAQAVDLTPPHKPENEDERRRIEEKGGVVIHLGTWRVNGNLAVSRAIGDASQKPYITSEADVVTCDMDGSENYLVLACDGFWDVVNKDYIPSLVYEAWKEVEDKDKIPQYLVSHARKHGSRDNITVLVVFISESIPEPLSGEATAEGNKNSSGT